MQGHSDYINCVAVLPDVNIISSSSDETLKVWDIHTGQCLNTLQRHNGTIYCVAISPNGNVISASRDNTLNVWDTPTWQCLNTLEGHRDSVSCIVVLPNGNVVSVCWDKTLKVWIDNELQNEYQIRKITRILAQGYRDQNCLFSLLPPEVNHKIAGLSGNLNNYTEEEATEIAKRYFCKS